MADAALPMFYKQPQPLDVRLHADFSLATVADYRFATDTNAVPLLASEFTGACGQYPIVFSPAEGAAPLALLGLRNGENLFVDARGHWAENCYIPAYVRRYPFIFMESADRKEFLLCIDTACSSVVRSTENPLFNNGTPTELTQRALTFCRAFQGEFASTREFSQAVLDAGLLIDNRADVTLKNGQKLMLTGFRVIDAEKFGKLPDATFLDWRQRGWLQLVYAHLISVGSWSSLINRSAAPRSS